MRRHGRGWTATLLFVAVITACLSDVWSAGPSGAHAQAETPPLGAAALLAWNDGNAAEAQRLSAAALRRDPADARALLVSALLARAKGDAEASFGYARAAYRQSDLEALRFDAALLAADALTRQERYARAQFWLRRAHSAAPDDARRALAARSYREVAARNPLAVRLRFGVSPSSNVNDGAETAEIEIGGSSFFLDDSGLQLGGYEAETGLSFSYRLSGDATQRTDLLGEVFYRKVWLDSEAKTIAPDADGSDFDYGVVAAGLRHSRLIWPELGPTSVSGVVGHTWYGGEALARWGQVRLVQTVKATEASAFRFDVSLRSETRLDDRVNDSLAVGLGAEYLFLSEGDARTVLGAFARDVSSDSATVDRLELGIEAESVFARTGPVVPRVMVTAATRDYRKWSTTPSGRRDTSLGLQLGVTFPDTGYLGFTPQLQLQARRTWSDVDIYDRNEVSVGLSIVSVF